MPVISYVLHIGAIVSAALVEIRLYYLHHITLDSYEQNYFLDIRLTIVKSTCGFKLNIEQIQHILYIMDTLFQ